MEMSLERDRGWNWGKDFVVIIRIEQVQEEEKAYGRLSEAI